MARILFCSPYSLSKEQGGPKVILELVEAMEKIGWEYDLLGKEDICPEADSSNAGIDSYKRSLFQYLLNHASEYDVVDYDHHCLPFPRTRLPGKTLFVARSVLLAHHFEVIPMPKGRGWKTLTRTLISGRRDRTEQNHRTQDAQITVEQADLVNVCNENDKTELMRSGISSDKIAVVPFGISRSRRSLFDAISSAVPLKPAVAFVGTFDYRKGAREFPVLVQKIVEAVPEVRFELLGTAGMFPTEAAVLAHFPIALRPRIEVIPRFKPEELPSLLAACSVGVFPSYIEGMPFGVLEMLAASVPVIAYDSPGPPMMLPPEYLVPRGNIAAMSDKVTALLKNEDQLREARSWAKKRSQQFDWAEIAEMTSEIYLGLTKSLQAKGYVCHKK